MLEEEEYLRRKEYYQESGQRHYYFMNIGNGEVIDAARKVSTHPSACAKPAQSCTSHQLFMDASACTELMYSLHAAQLRLSAVSGIL